MNSLAQKWHSIRTMPTSLKIMSIVTIAGIVIGVATLLVALSIARGFEDAYKRSILDFNAHVVLLRTGHVDEEMAVITRLHQLDADGEIAGITPFLYREGLAIAHGKIKGVVVKGVDPETLRNVGRMKLTLFAGDRFDQGILLGARLAEEFGFGAGGMGSLKMMVNASPQEEGERFAELKVVGIFEAGLYDYDSQFLLMKLENVRELFKTEGNALTGWEIALHDPEEADRFIQRIRSWSEDAFHAMSWHELNRDLLEAIALEKRVFAIIMGTLVVVAALNIISILVLMILFRREEVALLKALGMNRVNLIRLLTAGGFRIGFIGVVAGLLLGIGISLFLSHVPLITIEPEIYFLDRLPLDISPLLCGFTGTFCLVVCWGTSRIAAWRLSSLPMGEALRHI